MVTLDTRLIIPKETFLLIALTTIRSSIVYGIIRACEAFIVCDTIKIIWLALIATIIILKRLIDWTLASFRFFIKHFAFNTNNSSTVVDGSREGSSYWTT